MEKTPDKRPSSDSYPVKRLTLKEAVRKRPGMYFGECDSRGVEQIVLDLVANGLDLFLTGKASKLDVLIDDNEITVIDDGPGLPLGGDDGDTPDILLKYHDRPSHDGHAPRVHLVLHGTGLAPINAGSSVFEISTWRDNELWRMKFSCGDVTEPKHLVTTGHGNGTTIRLKADPEIFGSARARSGVVRNRLFESAHLFPGFRLGLNGEIFCSDNGLKDLLYSYLQEDAWEQLGDLVEPFYFHDIVDRVDIQVAVAGVARDTSDVQRHSWVNGVRSPLHGSHVAGLETVLASLPWIPKALLIHVITHEPRFAASTKDQLSAEPVQKAVESALKEPLTDYFTKHQLSR
ncbi:MAG: hypothetical protein AAFN07_16695 [Pseudomonadota bacterium]